MHVSIRNGVDPLREALNQAADVGRIAQKATSVAWTNGKPSLTQHTNEACFSNRNFINFRIFFSPQMQRHPMFKICLMTWSTDICYVQWKVKLKPASFLVFSFFHRIVTSKIWKSIGFDKFKWMIFGANSKNEGVSINSSSYLDKCTEIRSLDEQSRSPETR